MVFFFIILTAQRITDSRWLPLEKVQSVVLAVAIVVAVFVEQLDGQSYKQPLSYSSYNILDTMATTSNGHERGVA